LFTLRARFRLRFGCGKLFSLTPPPLSSCLGGSCQTLRREIRPETVFPSPLRDPTLSSVTHLSPFPHFLDPRSSLPPPLPPLHLILRQPPAYSPFFSSLPPSSLFPLGPGGLIPSLLISLWRQTTMFQGLQLLSLGPPWTLKLLAGTTLIS